MTYLHIKCYFVKRQTHFSQNLLFIGCDIFPQVMVICLHLIKHVTLGFNILLALPVRILRAILWKVVMICKIVLLLTSVALSLKKYIFEVVIFYLTDPINPIFAVVV